MLAAAEAVVVGLKVDVAPAVGVVTVVVVATFVVEGKVLETCAAACAAGALAEVARVDVSNLAAATVDISKTVFVYSRMIAVVLVFWQTVVNRCQVDFKKTVRERVKFPVKYDKS